MVTARDGTAGWDARLRWRLAAMGFALFVFLTAELFPIGALPELSHGLDVAPATTGLLLTAYAVIAGAATAPMLKACRRVERRRLLCLAMVVLAVSQLGFSLAPTFGTAAGFRTVAAVVHGVLWSQIPVVATRYAPSGSSGRATAAVFVGSSAGLLLGAPLSAALAQAIGWRWASAMVAAAAIAAAVLLRAALPPTAPTPRPETHRMQQWRPIIVVCAATVLLVIGHYIGYTYLALFAGRAGFTGIDLALVLAGYGVAGLIGVTVIGRLSDARPYLSSVAVAAALSLAIGALNIVNTGWPVLVSLLVWGGGAGALPVILQGAVLRGEPGARDRDSGAYVVAYQVGIASGSAVGAMLLIGVGIDAIPLWSGLPLVIGTMLITLNPGTFGRRSALPTSAMSSHVSHRT